LYCTSISELRKNHADLLQKYRHVRYMWIPYTDSVVVVVSDVAAPNAVAKDPLPEQERLQPFQDLLRKLDPNCGSLNGDNFAMLREKALRLDPLNADHVAAASSAAARSGYWRIVFLQGQSLIPHWQTLITLLKSNRPSSASASRRHRPLSSDGPPGALVH
jgi:hypothetical protein